MRHSLANVTRRLYNGRMAQPPQKTSNGGYGAGCALIALVTMGAFFTDCNQWISPIPRGQDPIIRTLITSGLLAIPIAGAIAALIWSRTHPR